MTLSRKASHAGSWYSSSQQDLNGKLNKWLDSVETKGPPARAIVSPHAGYRYSGECAAFAYKQIDPGNIERVFVLGPSHKRRVEGCAVTQAQTYETPLYDLIVDTQVNEELLATGRFEKMDIATDEEEHSIEMQLPYIAKIMESKRDSFKIVPILVGAINFNVQRDYGVIFSKYLSQPENLFIISSDFCHWGSRFSFTYHDKTKGEIYQSIEDLDKQGMDHIESLKFSNFQGYLDRYSNTICGRRPIGIFLNAVESVDPTKELFSFKFHKYTQSKKCLEKTHSSVSYAAGSLTCL